MVLFVLKQIQIKISLIKNHSDDCLDLKKEAIQNIVEVKNEIKKCDDFRKELFNFLSKNTLISEKEFKKYGYNLYKNYNCSFNLKEYTLKIIFQTFKKNTIIYTEFSTLLNKYNNKIFFRTYNSSMHKYKNKDIEIKFIVFKSDFMLNRMNSSYHWYIDGTFIHPDNYTQWINIMFIDILSGKKISGFYILMNSKTEIAYSLVLRYIKELFEENFNDNKLNILSYTTDFEINLIN